MTAIKRESYENIKPLGIELNLEPYFQTKKKGTSRFPLISCMKKTYFTISLKVLNEAS